MADSLDLLAANGGVDTSKPGGGLDLLPEGSGPFRRGFGAGMAGVKGNLAGAAALIAHGVGAVAPAPVAAVAGNAEKTALDYAAQQSAVAGEDAQGVENVDWTSPAAVAAHFKYLVGQSVPSLALMFAGGAAGRGLGAVAGRAAPAAAETLARAGMFAGAVAPDVALEAGGIYPDALASGAKNPATRAAVGGAAAASLDFFPLLSAERYMGAAGKGGIGAMLKGALKAAPVGAALEGTQELGQAVIERLSAGQSLTSPDAISDYINSFAGGAAPGLLFGAGAGALHGRAAPVTNPRQPSTSTAVPEQPAVQPAPASTEGGQPPVAEQPTPLPAITGSPEAATDLPFIQPDGVPLPPLDASSALDPVLLPAFTPALEPSPDRGTAPAAAPLGSDLLADPNAPAPAVPSDPAALAQQRLEAERVARETEQRQTADALARVREQHGMPRLPDALIAPEDRFAPGRAPTTALSPREVALARADSTARETVASPNVQAQMQAVEPHAMQVVEPMVKALAEAKSPTPGGQAKVTANLTKAIRSVVTEAAKQPSVEAAQAHIEANLPAALKGQGVAKDAEDIAKAVSVAVGQARTQFSKGAQYDGDVVFEKPVDGTYVAKVNGVEVGRANLAGGNTHITSVRIDPLYQRKGIGSRLYAHIERDIGHRLKPSPTHQSPAAKALWAKRNREPNLLVLAGVFKETQNSIDGWANKRGLPGGAEAVHDLVMKGALAEEDGFVRLSDYGLRLMNGGVESRAALTQSEYDALPPAAQSKVMDEYNRLMTAKGTALISHLKALIGNDPGLTVTTKQAAPGEPIGSYTRVDQLKSVIALATNAKDGLSVADHEGYHYAEDRLLDSRERQIVANALKKDSPIYNQVMAKVQAYDLQSNTKLADEVAGTPAEARAYAFEFWRRGELKAEGALARVWAKVRQVLERVGNAVRGLGFQSMEDVFTALDMGQMAERQRASGDFTGDMAFASRSADYTNTPEFKRWFGASKVVNADGSPRVVYHTGYFEEDYHGVPTTSEGMHFGTKAAAEARDHGKRVDDFVAATTVYKGEDSQGKPAWFWESGNVNSFEVVSEDGYATKKEAEAHAGIMAREYADSESDSSEPLPMTQAYLSIKNPMRVPDQHANWADAIAKAKAAGHDGIVYRNQYEDKGSDSWIAFRPEQIKSAVGNTGAFDPNNPDIRFSQAGDQKWYRSALTDAVVGMNTKQASVQGWRDQIKGLVAKGTVKQAELDAVGLDDWLEMQKGRVTKDQVLGFLGQNGVQVTETVLGEQQQGSEYQSKVERLRSLGWEIDGEDRDIFRFVNMRDGGEIEPDNIPIVHDPALDLMRNLVAMAPEGRATKFASYQLPGGANYRELLLTLPGVARGATEAEVDKLAMRLVDKGMDGFSEDDRALLKRGGNEADAMLDDLAARVGIRTDDVRRAMSGGDANSTFRSSHYDQANILAHVRFNERTDAEGKRVLFVEEFQSDWAQKGKKEGFNDGHIPEGLTIKRTDSGDQFIGTWSDGGRAVGPYNTEAEVLRQAAAKKGSGIPTAPFVTKTEAWVALSLKRMIRYAAENGFDRVAWTTGEQQAERYDLSKQVDRVVVPMVNASGTRSVRIDPTNGTAIKLMVDAKGKVTGHGGSSTQFTGKSLDEVIGKDIAEKVMRAPAGTTLSGLDLKVGGEGMKAFYDKIVPSVAKDVLKKLGGGSVGEVKIDSIPGGAREAGDVADRAENPEFRMLKQPGFDITPQMVAKVTEGIPLFSRGAVDPSPSGMGRVLDALTPDQRTLYSHAATTAEADMGRREAAGELQQAQAFAQSARMMQDAQDHGADNLVKTALGAVNTQITGGLSRWAQKNILTPNYVSSLSTGFKNVYRTLNTYIRYRDNLAERMLVQQIPQWYTASTDDQTAAFTALNKRNVEGYTKDSVELRALRASLTPKQLQMFDSATRMFEGFLTKELEVDDAFYRKVYTTPGLYEEEIGKRREQVAALIDKGYMPLRRYGDHTVRVFVEAPGPDNTTQEIVGALEFFTHEATAQLAAKTYQDEIARTGAKMRVEVGMHYKPARDSSISAQQFLETARRNGVALTSTEQERIVKALSAGNALMRQKMLHREGMPGYSKDGMRVMNEFGLRMAGKIAFSEFAHIIDAANDGRAVESDIINGQPVVRVDSLRVDAQGNTESKDDYLSRSLWTADGPMSGFHKGMAQELTDYVMVPDHTGQWSKRLRGAAMMYFIGGSISSGAVNAMSVPMMVVPQLSVHTNYGNALATTMGAWKDTWRSQHILRDVERLKEKNDQGGYVHAIPGVDEVAGLREALIAATQYTMDTELHSIMGISQGQFFSQNQTVQRAMKAWMAPFRVSEQTNRITSFIAGYKVGKANGLTGPALFNFARDTVDTTQNSYTQANRPGAARNPVFALLFMFKSFPLFMVEAAHLMYKANPRSAVYMLLGLTAMTGVQGLPFAETIEDLIDTIAQNIFGSAFNTRRAMRNLVKQASESFTGYDASDLVLRGLINQATGMSVSSRIGAGDFVPGSRLGTADADQGKILSDFLGAPYSMVKDSITNVGGALGGLVSGDWKQTADALRAGGPVALRNAIKGAQQLSDGYASDAKGRKLVDVNGLEGMLQMTGVSPAALAKAYETERINVQVKAFYTQVSGDLQRQLVQAIKAGDTAKVQEVTDLRNAWNKQYPGMPIMASPGAIRRDLTLSGMTLDRRSMAMWGRRIRGENLFADGQQ